MKNRRIVVLAWVLGLIIIWELASWTLANVIKDDMATSKLPYLHEIVLNMVTQASLFIKESSVTLSNSFLGFLLGATVGIILAIWMSLSKLFERITFPYLIFLQMIPVLGLAPIIFGIVRDEYVARIIISAYITFFPVSVGVLSGMRSVKKEQRDFMYSYAANKWELYTKLLLPASLPNLFNSLKVTAPLSITAAILVELMGAQKGIGVLILRNLYYGTPQVVSFWASVFVSAILGIVSFQFIGLLERILVQRRHPREEGG